MEGDKEEEPEAVGLIPRDGREGADDGADGAELLVPGGDAEADGGAAGGASGEATAGDASGEASGGSAAAAGMRRAVRVVNRRRGGAGLAVALATRAFAAAARRRKHEKTLRTSVSVALSAKALELHARRCDELGELAAVDLGPEDLKRESAAELFAQWDIGDEEKGVLTESKLRAALVSMELHPTQALMDEFVGELPPTQPSEAEDTISRPAESVWLDKEMFIARILHLANPATDIVAEMEARRWAPWSICGFSCNCLPWGATRVQVSASEITVARSHRALLCPGGYRSVDIFDMGTSKWMQVRKNIVRSSAIVTYLIEALLVFAICASFFRGHFSVMTAVSSFAALGWLGFRIGFMVWRHTSIATIYAPGLPSSPTGGSAGSFEITRPDCPRLLDAFLRVKLSEPVSSSTTARYVCPRPAVFFAERWIRLNAPHTLELGTETEHFTIEKVADASPPGCRPFSDTTWHAGMVVDIPWIHTHSSGRDFGTLCVWLLKGFAAALVLGFLSTSVVPECHDGSPCEEDALNAKIARLPPFSNVSATDCQHPFDFSPYQAFKPHGDDEEYEPNSQATLEAEMSCIRRADEGHCFTSHEHHRSMLQSCRPVCGRCREDDGPQLTCDARCEDFACKDFTCGSWDMQRQGDVQSGTQTLYGMTCVFPGGGADDGVCDEAVGWCLPGTDGADCQDSSNYIENLYSRYRYTDVLENRNLHWYASVAEASDDACRNITVLERCAACRASNFKCSPYNPASDFPTVAESCSAMQNTGMLHTTPWCMKAAADEIYPACSCLPPHLRALPNWKLFAVITAGFASVIWLLICLRWATHQRRFCEFGTLGVNTTTDDHALKFRIMDENKGEKIAMEVMRRKLGRPLNHDIVQTYEYTVPAMRRLFNKGRVEKMIIHRDYLRVETVKGLWFCNCWTRYPAHDVYYILLKDTSFIETGENGEPTTSKTARFFLALGFALMFSSYLGGILSYAIKRWHIPAETITAGKWFGLVFAISSFFLIRTVSGTMKQQFLHVGCSAGGTLRGRRNPHGGYSPFYVQIRGQSDADTGELKEVIRATRTESNSVVVENGTMTGVETSAHKAEVETEEPDTATLDKDTADPDAAKSDKAAEDPETAEVDTAEVDPEAATVDIDAEDPEAAEVETDAAARAAEHRKLAKSKSSQGLRSSLKDIEVQVVDGLLDEHKEAVTAQDIRMRAIDTVFKRTDADASGTLSRDEIASAIASLGIEMNVDSIMKKWDTDLSGTLERAEFISMMLEILDPNSALAKFSAQDFCPMNFYGIDFDWLPWGQRTTVLSRIQIELKGKSGFAGIPLLTDYTDVELEVPRMRWLMLDQNPASMMKFNSYLAEALTLYTIIAQLYVLAHQHPRTIGSIVALMWLTGRFVYLFMRARAFVHIHAIGVPPPSMNFQHKGSFPVDLAFSNPLIGEFLLTKGVISDAPTDELVTLVEPRIPMCRCKICPGRETHRMLLIGDTHFVVEKVSGDHTKPPEVEDDAVGEGTEAADGPKEPPQESAEDTKPPEVEDDAVSESTEAADGPKEPPQESAEDTKQPQREPFDVANKRLLLAPARTFRRKVLAGLIQDVYWVAVSRRSLSLRKFARQIASGLVVAFFLALPISLISSQTRCLNTLDLHRIMDGREYDTDELFPADQKENFQKWCKEFPIDLNDPQIPSACADMHREDYTMPDSDNIDGYFDFLDLNNDATLSDEELEVGLARFSSHLTVGAIKQQYDVDHSGFIERGEFYAAMSENIFNRRMDPAMYVRDKAEWCRKFSTEKGQDPCDCNWWLHHMPDVTILSYVWGGVFFALSMWTIRGVCRKERFYAELGIAGVPNQTAGHMARVKVPEEQLDRIPFGILESRLGRPIRKKKLLDIEYKPAFDCCASGKLDTLHIHEDYLHLEALKGRCCLRRLCCCYKAAGKMETDDYYVLLRDTGFVEVIEQNNVAGLVVRWCVILAVLCGLLDVFLKWALAIPNPSLGERAKSTATGLYLVETVDVTVGRLSRIGVVALPLLALLAYWIGTKLRHGYIHIGVRPGGTHRGFINRFGSTSPFHFRVRASSPVEVYDDAAKGTPHTLGKFSEPFTTVVHALRAARTESRQMDALVELSAQSTAISKAGHSSLFRVDTKGRLARFGQGQLSAAATALGALPVIVDFAEADLEAQALEAVGDAAIELENFITDLWGQ